MGVKDNGKSGAGAGGAPISDWDAVWVNANLATMRPDGNAYGAVPEGALAVKGGRIAWIGPMAELPAAQRRSASREHDAEGRWITPGLIDCHTHLVFGGNRAGEFEQRLEGASYEEIGRAGGGIRATVAATRAAGEEDLVRNAAVRLGQLCAEGVTTVEIKSGYGLDAETEIKSLKAARRLGEMLPAEVTTTFLGAHALPPEYEGRQDDYVALVCGDMLPAVSALGLADAVDAFCERMAFTPAQTADVFRAAGEHGLPVKLHADQLSDQGGAALAASFGALSADHLEYANEEGIAAMAESGTVAVLLPGAYYALGETRPPPVAALRSRGVPMAVATDLNPGSSPAASILLMLNMACTLFRLTPEEALAGVTRNAARALGLGHDRGVLAPGLRADLALWDIGHPAELAYWIGFNPIAGVIRDGEAAAGRANSTDRPTL
jgi:imidazolonepropionase